MLVVQDKVCVLKNELANRLLFFLHNITNADQIEMLFVENNGKKPYQDGNRNIMRNDYLQGSLLDFKLRQLMLNAKQVDYN
jgi:hypothetical protein